MSNLCFANQFLSSSFLDYRRKWNDVEEIVYLTTKSGETQQPHKKHKNCT